MLVAAGALTLMPASASAAGRTYCVQDPGCAGIGESTIAAALGAAGSAGGSIYVGPGTYSEGALTDPSGSTVNLIGAGYGRTTIDSTGSPALTVDEPGSLVSDLSIVSGGTAIQGGGTFQRLRITAPIGVDVTAGPTSLDDSLIASTSLAVEAPSATVALLARHDTLVGPGGAGTGVNCAGGCAALVDSSIIRGFATALSTSASLTIDYSDFDPGLVAGKPILGSHDIDADPLFAPGAFALSTPSPAIDVGDPALGNDEPGTDLAGAPRMVSGHVGSPPVSDMGAFEYQPVQPGISLHASAGRVEQGTRVTFTATVTPVNAGDVITGIGWSFDDGATARGASATHAFSTPGTHSGWVTVTDLNGFELQSRPVTVTVTPKPGPPTAAASITGLTAGRPVLHLELLAGPASPNLRSLSITLSSGLSFERGGVKGLSITGARAKRPTVAGGKLTLTLTKPSGGFAVKLAGPLLVESNGLLKKAKRGQVRHVRVSLVLTDSSGHRTTLRL